VEVKLKHSRLPIRLEGGNIAYKHYANRLPRTKYAYSLKFAPAGSTNSVKSVMLPGQKGLLTHHLDRIFAFPRLSFSSFITLHLNDLTCLTP
jgi:hypothetical protein